jgi:hypothetical protein
MKVKVTLNLIIVKQDLRNLTGKASSLQNNIPAKEFTDDSRNTILNWFIYAVQVQCRVPYNLNSKASYSRKSSSHPNHIKGRPTKLLIMYEAFLCTIWAPCVWHECVCCMCVSVSELNGGVRRGVR